MIKVVGEFTEGRALRLSLPGRATRRHDTEKSRRKEHYRYRGVVDSEVD